MTAHKYFSGVTYIGLYLLRSQLACKYRGHQLFSSSRHFVDNSVCTCYGHYTLDHAQAQPTTQFFSNFCQIYYHFDILLARPVGIHSGLHRNKLPRCNLCLQYVDQNIDFATQLLQMLSQTWPLQTAEWMVVKLEQDKMAIVLLLKQCYIQGRLPQPCSTASRLNMFCFLPYCNSANFCIVFYYFCPFYIPCASSTEIKTHIL